MRNYKMHTLFFMVGLAVIFAILLFVFWSPRNNFTLLGLFISALLLIIDLMAIISFVFVAFIFKADNLQQAVKYTSISVVSLIVFILVVMVLVNPLRLPQGLLRERFLRLTPIGTSMESVIEIVESRDEWEVRLINYERGYPNHDYKAPGVSTSSTSVNSEIIGEKSITVYAGEYANPFITSVTIYWGFDEDSKLIDIYIWKSMDVW